MSVTQSKASLVIPVEGLSARGTSRTIVPDTVMLEVIAKRLKIPAAEALSATVAVNKKGRLIQIQGALQARLTRVCIVSLETMSENLDETFSLDLLVSRESAKAPTSEAGDGPGVEILIDEYTPEPFYEAEIDLQEIVIQQLVLAMASYPRKPNAVPVQDTKVQPSLSAFAALASLQSTPEDKAD